MSAGWGSPRAGDGKFWRRTLKEVPREDFERQGRGKSGRSGDERRLRFG
jgi:hypothetical protein